MARKDGLGAEQRAEPATLDLKAERIEEPSAEPAESMIAPGSLSERRFAGSGPFLHLLAAGLIGAIIGATAMIVPRLHDERAQAGNAAHLSARLAALEQRVTPLAETAAKTAEIAGKAATADAVARLARKLEGLEESAGRQMRETAERLTARSAEIEALARKAAEAPPSPPPAAIAPELLDRLAKLEAGLLARDPAAAKDLTETLAQRLARVELALAQAKPGADPSRVEEIATSVAALSPRLAEEKAIHEARLAELTARLSAAEAALRAQGQSVVAADLVRQRALAEALIADYQRGRPYKQALDGLTRLGLDTETTAKLAPFAASGAPNGADLAKLFAPIASRVPVTGTVPKTDSVAERLTSSLSGLVKVRPIDASGNEPAAIVARIEAALMRNAFADAAKAWDTLPESVRGPSQGFAELLFARAAADKAVSELQAETLRRLTATRG